MVRKKVRTTIHYIYKIIFLCGTPKYRYYYGKRSAYIYSPESDKYHGSGKFCAHYFAKYGAILGETYIKEIVEINPNRKINAKREDFWLGDKWKTDPLCMNMRRGGEGGAIVGHTVSDETRKKIGAFHKGNKWCLGRKHTEEAKEKDRIAHLGNKYGLGHKLSDEHKQKIRERSIIAVQQYTLDGTLVNTFPAIIDAASSTNICRTKIASCCTKKRLTAGGYIWRHTGEILSSEELEYIQKHTKCKQAFKSPVIRIDLVSGEETVYMSIREAARQNNISDSSITGVCRHERKTAAGYKWKYMEDVENA